MSAKQRRTECAGGYQRGTTRLVPNEDWTVESAAYKARRAANEAAHDAPANDDSADDVRTTNLPTRMIAIASLRMKRRTGLRTRIEDECPADPFEQAV